MTTLVRRHLTLFFKDKASVFFSLFSVFIIIALYILFLSENMMASLPEFEGRVAFVFLWMFAGIIAVTTATATLGALGKYMEDKVAKKSEDLLMTKVTRQTLAYSYVFYVFVVGLILTALLLVFGYVYVGVKFADGLQLSLSLLAVVLLSTLMHTLLFYLITEKLLTMSAFSGLATIVGTLIGFMAGIYIPIGVLPVYLQKIITLFPTTQTAVLVKDVLMDDVLSSMQTMIPEAAYDELVFRLGIQLEWNGQVLASSFSWIYMLVLTLILCGIVWWRNRRI
ncbi:MAG TPA: hypothetical protein VK067_05375 [Pseudogracilibacillus sp.]|nr:hypothetical protein [Pseudogracilibacillus sp.]